MKTFMSLNSDVHLLWLNCFSLTENHHENHMFQFVNVHVYVYNSVSRFQIYPKPRLDLT